MDMKNVTPTTHPNDPAQLWSPNDTAQDLMSEAKAIYLDLAKEAGRSEAGRCYRILITELEKIIYLAEGYFPRR